MCKIALWESFKPRNIYPLQNLSLETCLSMSLPYAHTRVELEESVTHKASPHKQNKQNASEAKPTWQKKKYMRKAAAN